MAWLSVNSELEIKLEEEGMAHFNVISR